MKSFGLASAFHDSLLCSPGIGKGTLVKEIDALDGLMARVIDKSSLQSQVLNRSKGANFFTPEMTPQPLAFPFAGPAVQGPRAQADRELYRKHMLNEINNTPNLETMAGGAEDLMVS